MQWRICREGPGDRSVSDRCPTAPAGIVHSIVAARGSHRSPIGASAWESADVFARTWQQGQSSGEAGVDGARSGMGALFGWQFGQDAVAASWPSRNACIATGAAQHQPSGNAIATTFAHAKSLNSGAINLFYAIGGKNVRPAASHCSDSGCSATWHGRLPAVDERRNVRPVPFTAPPRKCPTRRRPSRSAD